MLSSENYTTSELIQEQAVSEKHLRYEYTNRINTEELRMDYLHPILRNKYNEVN